jgi:hypothetical protein
VHTLLDQSALSLVKASAGLYLQTNRQQLPQTFADNQLAGQQVTLGLGLSEKDWEFNLQANLKNDELINDDSDVSFEGSYLAGSAANQWLIAGQIPT